MLVFRMLCRITQSSDTHRTESVMDHEQSMKVNSRMLGPLLGFCSYLFTWYLFSVGISYHIGLVIV